MNDDTPDKEKEKEIDLLEIFYRLWSRKKLLLMWGICGALAGLVIAFSIPREYTTEIKLAPETNSNTRAISGGLGALASMAGISSSATTGSDAVYPQLYPDIVSSVPFSTSLFDVVVSNKDGENFTVRDYLENETHKPWWKAVTGLPIQAVGFIMNIGNAPEKEEKGAKVDNFKLTREEDRLVKELARRVQANVDQKTNVITISSMMQDPVVSAILADTVVARLREYVTQYRTNKARHDLDYALKLNQEAQQEYYKSQQRLADFMDRNQNLATRSAQVNQERLENEASLAFNLYNETSLQVQSAKSRVQETTPVYTEITPATVPMRPTSPRKGLIIAGGGVLGIIICSIWIIFASPIMEEYKKIKKQKEPDAELQDNSEHEKIS